MCCHDAMQRGELVSEGLIHFLLRMAHPSLDHYLPALTVAGAADDRDQLLFMNDAIDLSSVSMRSFIYY